MVYQQEAEDEKASKIIPSLALFSSAAPNYQLSLGKPNYSVHTENDQVSQNVKIAQHLTRTPALSLDAVTVQWMWPESTLAVHRHFF